MAETTRQTTTVRAYDDDVERLDSISTRGESYADALSRVLDAAVETDQIDA